jgi:hypothetical protein
MVVPVVNVPAVRQWLHVSLSHAGLQYVGPPPASMSIVHPGAFAHKHTVVLRGDYLGTRRQAAIDASLRVGAKIVTRRNERVVHATGCGQTQFLAQARECKSKQAQHFLWLSCVRCTHRTTISARGKKFGRFQKVRINQRSKKCTSISVG